MNSNNKSCPGDEDYNEEISVEDHESLAEEDSPNNNRDGNVNSEDDLETLPHPLPFMALQEEQEPLASLQQEHVYPETHQVDRLFNVQEERLELSGGGEGLGEDTSDMVDSVGLFSNTEMRVERLPKPMGLFAHLPVDYDLTGEDSLPGSAVLNPILLIYSF